MYFQFYCKNNGVLFENDLIQIGVKTECRSNLARLALFYGNKTQSAFANFQPIVTCSPELSQGLSLQVKTVDSTVDAGAQFQQMLNCECVNDFSQQPDLNLSFICGGAPNKLSLKVSTYFVAHGVRTQFLLFSVCH